MLVKESRYTSSVKLILVPQGPIAGPIGFYLADFPEVAVFLRQNSGSDHNGSKNTVDPPSLSWSSAHMGLIDRKHDGCFMMVVI